MTWEAWLGAAALLAVGCTDEFTLPLPTIGSDGADAVDLAAAPPFDLAPPASDAGADASLDLSSSSPLPLACKKLGCTPSTFEGDATLLNATVSGCHAYGTVRIGLGVTAVRDPLSGTGFGICADTIILGGSLSADGEGQPAASGPGAGNACGSGGGYGGTGADPSGCGGGATYGDMMNPRSLGSGGGGPMAGAGGGAIELAVGHLDIFGVIHANGGNASGPGGGGSGGSVLINADSITGPGQVTAIGGHGAGGGGGGRIAVYSTGQSNLALDAHGGDSAVGPPAANGTAIKTP